MKKLEERLILHLNSLHQTDSTAIIRYRQLYDLMEDKSLKKDMEKNLEEEKNHLKLIEKCLKLVKSTSH